MVVKKGKDRAAKRNNHIRSGRLQSRNQPQQVAEQDEQAQNGDEAEEAFKVVTDDGFALLGDKLMNSFREMLQRIGLFDIERQANRDKENQEDRDDQQFHRKRVVDGCIRIGGMNVKYPEQRIHRRGKEVIQESRKKQLGRHKSR